MKSFSHVSSVFSRMMLLKADDRAQAKAGLDFAGMKHKVGGTHSQRWGGFTWFGLGGNCREGSRTEELHLYTSWSVKTALCS